MYAVIDNHNVLVDFYTNRDDCLHDVIVNSDADAEYQKYQTLCERLGATPVTQDLFLEDFERYAVEPQYRIVEVIPSDNND